MVSQVARGTKNTQISVAASQNVTITVNGQDAVELEAPGFPKSLPDVPREIDLLKAVYGVTALQGRAELLKDFLDWALDEHSISVRTLIGPGGAGKTRFAWELYRCIREQQGWNAWFLRFLRNEARGVNLWQETSGNALIIIDYASDVAAPLAQLLRSIDKSRSDGRRLRLLLLARTASWDEGWLSSLRSGRTGGDVEQLFRPQEPLPMPILSSAERYNIFIQTSRQIAEITHRSPPPSQPADVFEKADVAERLKDPLTLMMAAAASLRIGAKAALDLSRSELAFETAKELVANRMREAVSTHRQLFLHMAAFATMCGGLDQDEALLILDRESEQTHLGPVPDPASFVNALHEWLPGEKTWIGSIQPDIVAEAFLLGDKKPVYLVSPEAAILRAVDHKPKSAIATIVRIAQDFSSTGDSRRQEPLQWIRLLIQKGERDQGLDLLVELLNHIPTSTFSLGNLALEISETMLKRVYAYAKENGGVGADVAAAVLDSLAIRQANAGQIEEALESAEQSVALYRELVKGKGHSSLRGLAGALTSLSIRKAAMGRYKSALGTAREAESILQILVRPEEIQTLEDWATGLSNLSNRQNENGLWTEALENGYRAVELRRNCVRQDRATFLPGLAGSLVNLANHLAEAKQLMESLASAREAAELYEEIVRFRRDEYLAEFARALDSLANHLADVGLSQEALAKTIEAVGLWREAVKLDRDAFLHDLAATLHNLSLKQEQVHQYAEAVVTAEESVSLWRDLAGLNRDAYLHGLAVSLHNLSTQQKRTGQPAVDTIKESIGLWHEAVSQNRIAFLPDLAGALSDFALLQAEENGVEAIAAAEEAVELGRELAHSNPNSYASNLAKSLNNLGDLYDRFGEPLKARRVLLEASDLYGVLIERLDYTWLGPAHARALASLGRSLMALRKFSEAAETYSHALRLIREWEEEKPGKISDFAKQLRISFEEASRSAGREPADADELM